MEGSIFSLIQENKKLFYRGEIRNSYKKDRNPVQNSSYIPSDEGVENRNNFKQKSYQFFQDIFNE